MTQSVCDCFCNSWQRLATNQSSPFEECKFLSSWGHFGPAGDRQSLSRSQHLQNWQLSTGKRLPEERSETRVATAGLPPRSLLSRSRAEATFWAISGDYRSIWQCSCRSWEVLVAKISLSLSVCAKKRGKPSGMAFISWRTCLFLHRWFCLLFFPPRNFSGFLNADCISTC